MCQVHSNNEEFNRKQIESIIYGNRTLDYIVFQEAWACGAWNERNPSCEWVSAGTANEIVYQITTTVNQQFYTIALNDQSYGICLSAPFTEMPPSQLGLLNVEDERIQNLIFQIRMSSLISYRERIATELLALNDYAKEEGTESTGISLGSLRGFYDFIRMHNNLKCPIISLTPDDNVYLSWRGEENRLFSLHFLPGGEVRFVVFKPNDMHPEKEDRISGRTTYDALKEAVIQYHVWDWISE